MEWVAAMTTVKLAEWVAQKLADHGITHAFMVTGGGAMHLNHAIGSHSKIETVFNHHEQACAIAAEGYYRISNRLPVVNVTSGPGGTNAITGVYGAFADSIGMLVLSGQVKWETTVRSTGLPLRQYGDQELDIEQLVKPITKYCVMVTDPLSIRYHLEKAIYLATSGRPGPCWLDIPLDVQASKIDPSNLKGFDPSELDEPWKRTDLVETSRKILDKIASSERPVIYAGNGIRLSGQHQAFLELVNKLGIPVVTGFSAHDLVWETHPYYCGRPGTIGNRGGNFVVQNSDCLLVLGTRLNIRQVSYNWTSFAREAFKIWVDIDELELQRPNVKPDMPVVADLADLIPAMLSEANGAAPGKHDKWLAWSKERQRRFPVVLPEYEHNQVVNPYVFMKSLFEELADDAIVVAANATACITSFQAGSLKKGQRLWSNSGSATMGYDLPASIGACKASGNKPIICLAGDGSIMMNLQELQTIAGNKLPIKIFLLNNNGYVSIFQTHRNFFNGVEIGGGPKSGVSFPDFEPLMKAFGFAYTQCTRHNELKEVIRETLGIDGPVVCEISLDENVVFAPKLGAKQLPDGRIISPPLEDLSPFLPRDQFHDSMIIKTMNE
jgi:acetolactate synthase I/II/III large subunit